MNCRSLKEKEDLAENAMQTTKADAIIGKESWLNNTTIQMKFSIQLYNFKKGDNLTTMMEFVFVSSCLESNEPLESQSNDQSEPLWVKIRV